MKKKWEHEDKWRSVRWSDEKWDQDKESPNLEGECEE